MDQSDTTHIMLTTPIDDQGEKLNAIRILGLRDQTLGPPPRLTIAYQLGRMNKKNGKIRGFRDVHGYETEFSAGAFGPELSEFLEVFFKHAASMIQKHSDSEVAVEDAAIASVRTRKTDVEAENVKRAEDELHPLPVPDIPERIKHSFAGTLTISDDMAARVPVSK